MRMDSGPVKKTRRSPFTLKATKISSIVEMAGGLLLVLVVLTSNFLLSSIARSKMIQISEDCTGNIAENLTYAIFTELPTLYPEGEFGRNWKERAWQEKLNGMIHERIHGLGVIKVKIFDRQGRIIYSTDPEVIGALDPHNLKFKTALAGKISSRLEEGRSVWDFAWESGPRKNLIETYIPLRELGSKDFYRVIGVFEIYKDADFLMETLNGLKRTFLWTSLAVLGLIFAAFTPIVIKGLKRRLLWEKIDTVDEVAVGVKHRLNNSLTGILTSLDLLLHYHTQGVPLDEETCQILQKCEREARRIQDVVEKLSHVTNPVVTRYMEEINMIDLDKST